MKADIIHQRRLPSPRLARQKNRRGVIGAKLLKDMRDSRVIDIVVRELGDLGHVSTIRLNHSSV
jgi:hypothetical protein